MLFCLPCSGDIYWGASLSCILLPRYLLRSLTQACLPVKITCALASADNRIMSIDHWKKTVSVVTFLLCWKSCLIFMLLWMGHS